MSAPDLPGKTTTLIEASNQIEFTRARLAQDALTAAFVPDLDPIRAACVVIRTLEDQHRGAIIAANIGLLAADEALDGYVVVFASELLLVVKNDRSSSFYRMFFPTVSPAIFKRPKLGSQLDVMRQWPTYLAACPYPTLVACGLQLVPLLQAADAAVATAQGAEAAMETFNNVGERFAFFNQLNQVRQSIAGKLALIPTAHPELMLGVNYPKRFFMHRTTAAPTLTKLGAQLASLSARTAKMTTKQQAALDKKKKAEDDDVAIAAAENNSEAAKKNLAAAKLKDREAKKAAKEAKAAKKKK